VYIAHDLPLAWPPHRLAIKAAFAVLAAGAALAAQALPAETPEQLDGLVSPTTEVRQGMDLARVQAMRGELLEALASLERVLTRHPEAKEAQLLHASLRCRVDDGPGAQAEFARLNPKQFPKNAWTEATSVCTVPVAGSRRGH
jgi:hypothetical protein